MLGWFKKKQGPDCTHGILTPEQDIQVARAEYTAGHLVHAAYHVGCALSAAPTRAEWLALLDKISDVSPEPLKLAPVQEQNYFATMAVRAYLLHRLNRLDEGLDLLLQTVFAKPEVPYLTWAIQWAEEPGAAGKIESGTMRFLLQLVNGKLEEWQHTGGNTSLELLPRFIQAVQRSGTRDAQTLFLGASVLRRSGHAAEAFELARGAYQIQPNWESAVAMAYALRELDRVPEAYAAFQKALQHRPEEVSVHLDMGDMMWDQQNWDWAAHHYGEVLRREPNHPWALPSSHAVQFKKTGDARWKESVERLAEQGNDRAKQLMWEIGIDLNTFVPEPAEACISVAEQLIAQYAQRPHEIPQSVVEGTLSALEPASALLAVRYQFQIAGWPYPPVFKIEKLGTPDPRLPYGQVDYVLWRYQGNDALPNYPAAPQPVYSALGRIASQRYDLRTWSQWGRGIAQELGSIPVEQILGAMVNPPHPPAGMYAWTWIVRFQLAAALVVAGREMGWENTERRKVLLSMARGPMDWTVDAALIALAGIAREVPEAVPEIAALHLDRYRGMPDHGSVCYLPTLALCALNRPGIQDDERAHWLDILQHVGG